MQNLEDRLVQKTRNTKKRLEEKYFKEWKKAQTVLEREQAWTKVQVINDLTQDLIHDIRGDKHG